MPHHSPEISVIIPTFNRAKSILPALESVLAQTFANFEVIIVDDASEDATLSLLSTVNDPRMRVLRHERNRGAAAARNTGIEAARGSIIAFQDSDDSWHPQKLEKQLSALELTGRMNLTYCSLCRTWDGKTTIIPSRSIRKRDGNISEEILFHNFISTQTILLSKATLVEVGGFDEDLPCLEDWELNIRLAQSIGYTFVAEALVAAVVLDNSLSRNLAAAARALAMIHEKHAALYADNREANAKFFARRAHYEFLVGNTAEGRALVKRSLAVLPFYLPALAIFLLSHFGTLAYRKVVCTRMTTAQ